MENSFGKGRTLLVGTNPSVGYFRTDGASNASFYGELIAWAGLGRNVTLSNPSLFARVHVGETGGFLWLVNPGRSAQSTEVTIGEGLGTLAPADAAWPVGHRYAGGKVDVPARDVVILPLVIAR